MPESIEGELYLLTMPEEDEHILYLLERLEVDIYEEEEEEEYDYQN